MTDSSAVSATEHAFALTADLPQGTSVIIYDLGTLPLEEGVWSPRIRECVEYAEQMGWAYRTSIDVPADPQAPATVQLERVLRAMDIMVKRRAGRVRQPDVTRPPVALLVHDSAQLGAGAAVTAVEDRITLMGAHLVILARLESHRCTVVTS